MHWDKQKTFVWSHSTLHTLLCQGVIFGYHSFEQTTGWKTTWLISEQGRLRFRPFVKGFGTKVVSVFSRSSARFYGLLLASSCAFSFVQEKSSKCVKQLMSGCLHTLLKGIDLKRSLCPHKLKTSAIPLLLMRTTQPHLQGVHMCVLLFVMVNFQVCSFNLRTSTIKKQNKNTFKLW